MDSSVTIVAQRRAESSAQRRMCTTFAMAYCGSMAALHNIQLKVDTERWANQATIIATCDVEFTDFEVNAMKLLALRYAVGCQVLNRDLQYEDPVIRFDDQQLPSATAATPTEHVVFRSVNAMSDLHEHLFTRDELVAEFTLTNMETRENDVRRSNLVAVDLVP